MALGDSPEGHSVSDNWSGRRDSNAGNIFGEIQRPFTRFLIIFTKFFLIAVSTRFFALFSIRAALLIGSRCVVVFDIFFFLSFILRLGKQIHTACGRRLKTQWHASTPWRSSVRSANLQQ